MAEEQGRRRKREKKNKRNQENWKQGEREEGGKRKRNVGVAQRGGWKNIKKNNLVFCTHFYFLQQAEVSVVE
jgi:hypothetical protein